MTIFDTTNKTFQTGNGVNTAFDFAFKYFDDSEIYVEIDGVPVDSSDYTVTRNPSGEGGTVNLLSAPALDAEVLIYRLVEFTQESVIPTVDKLGKGALETAYDKLTALAQQLKEKTDRCIQIAFNQNVTPQTEITLVPRKAVVVNDTGDGFALSYDDFDNQASAAAESASDAAASALSASGSASSASISASTATSAKDAAVVAKVAAEAAQAAAEGAAGPMATIAEQLAGTSVTVKANPDTVAALWEKGTDINSGLTPGTITIPSTGGGFFHVTGTTTITAIAQTNLKTGRCIRLVFDGVLQLTHNATSFILPGGANITTAAGDAATFICENSGSAYWRCVEYVKASGLSVVSPSTGALVLLSTQTVSGATSVDFVSGIDSAYKKYFLDLIDVYPSTNAQDLWLRVSQDAGANWKTGASDYYYGTKFSNYGASWGDSYGTTNKILLARALENSAAKALTGEIKFYNPANTSRPKTFMFDPKNPAAGQNERSFGYGEYVTDNNAINGIRLMMSSGNITGTFKLYGVL